MSDSEQNPAPRSTLSRLPLPEEDLRGRPELRIGDIVLFRHPAHPSFDWWIVYDRMAIHRGVNAPQNDIVTFIRGVAVEDSNDKERLRILRRQALLDAGLL